MSKNKELIDLLVEKQSKCKHDGHFTFAGQQSIVNDIANQWIIQTTLMCEKCAQLVFMRNESMINLPRPAKKLSN